MLEATVVWWLIFHCANMEEPDCKFFDNLRYGYFATEKECVDEANITAQKMFDSIKVELEYSCTKNSIRHPNGTFVPKRR